MNSFNVYGQTTETIGGNTPIWLGTVKPIPVGAFMTGYNKVKAGTAGTYNPIDKSFNAMPSVSNVPTEILEKLNAFVYNDFVAVVGEDEGVEGTCALVMHHPEGLLIERVYPEITEEQIAALQKAIPGVLLVRG